MHQWSRQPVSIPTRWTADVNPRNAWPEYPRPQLVRAHWQNLNGLWEYAVTPLATSVPSRFQGRILVPFPIESALSGVAGALRPDQLLWYRRLFAVEPFAAGERILLHFGAVDYEATVYVNGHEVGTHSGGYQNFSCDITAALVGHSAERNELVVKVYDPTDTGPNPYGKQRLKPQWAFYTASSGIWQTVWIERVPSISVEKLRMTPDVDRGVLRLEVTLSGQQEAVSIEAEVSRDGTVITRQRITGATDLHIDQPRLWSPEDPFLYDLNVRVVQEDRVIDAVSSYFGLRKIELKKDSAGHARLYLNDRCTYHLGVVDQGFWPDGLHTAPTDAALKFDVQTIKALGFNAVRKHIKIETARWYAYCDRLGLLVWQDMPSGNNDTAAGRAQFEREIAANLQQLHNHPSIVVWGLFNEGWGVYDEQRLVHWMKAADPSRLLNAHSGPYDQLAIAQGMKRRPPSQLPGPLVGSIDIREEFQALQLQAKWPGGDLVDFHYYPGPRMPPVQENAAAVIGEHGSFGAFIPGHVFDESKPLGTGLGATGVSPTQLHALYEDSIGRMKLLQEQGLAASFYFQLCDVDVEQQGFLTYDREIAKVSIAEIARVNAKLVQPGANLAEATRGFCVRDFDPPFKATPREHNTLPPAGKTLDVIRQEFLDPQFKDRRLDPDWEAIEAAGVQRYGEAAREAVQGAKMMHDLVRGDWPGFARSYARYYSTAVGRSIYADHAVAYQVLKNVSDVEALNTAVSVMAHVIEQGHDFKFGRHDPSELDTYARLLHKIGRTAEARQWQEKAVALCEGRDQEIVRHFSEMQVDTAARFDYKDSLSI